MSLKKSNQQEKEFSNTYILDLDEIAGILKKRLKVILIFTLVAGITFGGIGIIFKKSSYATSATLLIKNIANEASSLEDVKEIRVFERSLDTYNSILNSMLLRNRIILKINKLSEFKGKGIEYKNLGKYVTISLKANTQVINISSVYKDPDTAYQLADIAMTEVMQRVTEVFGEGHLEVIQPVNEPIDIQKSSLKTNVLMGALAGLLLSSIWFLLRYFLNPRVRGYPDLENIGFQVLAEIPLSNIESKNYCKSEI